MIYVLKENQLEMVDLDQLTLNKNSHIIFNVSCDFNISNKCRKLYRMEFRQYIKLINNNAGKLPCLFCSRTMKFSNRNNPNVKYKSLDDNFFSCIDSPEKAYILGWIASDGHIGTRGFKIAIHKKDLLVLEKLRDIICLEIPIKSKKTFTSDLVCFEINSKQISRDLCSLLEIKPGKKSYSVKMPNISNTLMCYFLRGYFEGDGTINNSQNSKCKYPKGNIRSNSIYMLNSIIKFCKLTSSPSCNMISMSNKIFMNFLEFLYKDNLHLVLDRKYNLFIDWKNKRNQNNE